MTIDIKQLESLLERVGGDCLYNRRVSRNKLETLAPALARRVIAAEKLVNAIRDYWLKPDVQNSEEIEAILSEWENMK